MTEVILKGEMHTSKEDLKEERELVKDGVDHLILEGQAGESSYRWTENWFGTALGLFNFILIRNVWTDHTILVDLTEAQDAEIEFTRESDVEMVRDSHAIINFIGAVLFYGLIIISISYYGFIEPNRLNGATFLMLAAGVPVFFIRVSESYLSKGDMNRDKKMANKISNAAGEVNRVIAVVGDDHVDPILDHLPESLDPEVKRPVDNVYSIRHLRGIIVPVFTAFSVLYVLYLVLWYATGLVYTLSNLPI